MARRGFTQLELKSIQRGGGWGVGGLRDARRNRRGLLSRARNNLRCELQKHSTAADKRHDTAGVGGAAAFWWDVIDILCRK